VTRREHSTEPVDAIAHVLRVGDGRWVLVGPLTINNVAGVLDASFGVPLPETGRIDLKGVDPVDSAGVALLLEWKRRASVERSAVVFENVPPSMASLAKLYGVDGLLSPS
jgi:phospholipid transport system transporter-binding protein